MMVDLLQTKIKYLSEFSEKYFAEQYKPDDDEMNKKAVSLRKSCKLLASRLKDLFMLIDKHLPKKEQKDLLKSKTENKKAEKKETCSLDDDLLKMLDNV